MAMPGRSFSAGNQYRYGFNGQEKSDEIGDGLATALFWEYDSRIGRRWNVDPKQKVWESSYLCFSGNPILLSDLNGDNPAKKLYHGTKDAKNISKKGFNAEEHGAKSNYNWFDPLKGYQISRGTEIEVEADVSSAKVISKEQTDAWKEEAIRELGYTPSQFKKLSFSTNKTLYNKINLQAEDKLIEKVGDFMNKDGANLYLYERHGTYAMSDNFANSPSTKIVGFDGEGAPELLKSLESSPLSTEAATALKEWNSAAKMFKWGSRTVAILGVATAGYEIYMAENKPKEITKQVAGFGAGSYAAGTAMAAGWETGPWDLLIGAGAFAYGYYVGSKTVELVWQLTFERGVSAK